MAPKYEPRPSGHLEGDGYHVDVFGGPAVGGTLGWIRFSGRDGRAQIDVFPATPGSVEYWMRTLERLQMFNDDARQLRREAEPTTDDVIERYYRAKAAGGRVTLRQLAEATGMSYQAVLKHKQRYDAAGKWGSKKDKLSSENLDRNDLDQVL